MTQETARTIGQLVLRGYPRVLATRIAMTPAITIDLSGVRRGR